MKKIKFLIASMIGAIALVFACVLGTKVNAASGYFSWKNSSTLKLIDTGENGDISITDGSVKTDTTRASTITTSLIPNGATIASGDKSIKGGNSISFETKIACDFSAIVFFDSASAGTIKLKAGETEIANVNTSAGSKASYIISADGLSANTTYTLVGSKAIYVYEIYMPYVVADKTLTSLTEITVSKSYQDGDAVEKGDLIVKALYQDEIEAETTTKFTFKVYNSSAEEVTGVLTAGDGYYVVATSTEDTTKSVTSATFTVSEQTKFTYELADHFLSSITSLQDVEINDTLTVNGKYKSNSNTYKFVDDATFNKNMAQGSKIILHLTKAAKITVYAVQSGSQSYHLARHMYFEDNSGNSLTSSMNFSSSGENKAAKVCSIVLPAGDFTSYCSDGGLFNMLAVVIDFTDSESLNPNVSVKLRLEKSTGTALNGTGTAARFVGVLQGVDYSYIDTITIDFKLTLSNKTEKTAQATITNVYTGLPGYDEKDGTLYFYFVIKGLEKTTYSGCTIQAFSKVTYTNITENSYSATTWTNA